MALIKCPECEKEISDKATSCPHCGIPICTAGTVSEFNPDVSVTKKITRKFTIAAIFAVALIAIIIAISLGRSHTSNDLTPSIELDEDEKIALSDCETLQDMMKVPSSFEVYEAIVYHDELMGACSYITYGAENSYGAKLKSVAIFADGRYLGEYGDDEDDFASQREYDEFMVAHFPYYWYLVFGSDSSLRFIDTEKLMQSLKERY